MREREDAALDGKHVPVTAGPSGDGYAETDIFHITVIRDTPAFLALRDDWDLLAAQTAVPVFLSFTWLWHWWKHFGEHPGRELHLLAVKHDGVLKGIFPFFLERSVLFGVTIRCRLRLMGAGVTNPGSYGLLSVYGPSDYLGAIVHPASAAEITKAVVHAIVHDEPVIDEIVLEHLPAGSVMLTDFIPAIEEAGWQAAIAQTDACPYLRLPASVELFLASKSANTRRRLSQARKAAGDLFEIKTATSPADLERDFASLISLHQQRWNELGFTGLFSDRRFTAFHEDLSGAFFGQGNITVKSAHAGGKCVAVRLFYHYNGTTFDYLSGFDEHAPASRRRPGMAILLSMMEDAIRSGIRTMDFLRGDEGYKFDFTEHVRWNSRVQITSPIRRSGFVQLVVRCAAGFAALRFHLFQEWSLANVQLQRHGLFRGIPAYVDFRLKRLAQHRARKTNGVEPNPTLEE